MTSGVYKIYFEGNENHFYIGSTKDFKQRKAQHLSQLKTQRHDNPILRSAFKKYGEDRFKFEVVEETEPEIRLEKEQHYIDILEPAYNIRHKVMGGKQSDFWIFIAFPQFYKLTRDLSEICSEFSINTSSLRGAAKLKKRYLGKYYVRRLTEEEYNLGYYIPNTTGYLFIHYNFTINRYGIKYKNKVTRTARTIEEALILRNELIFKEKNYLSFLKEFRSSYRLIKLSEQALLNLENKFADQLIGTI